MEQPRRSPLAFIAAVAALALVVAVGALVASLVTRGSNGGTSARAATVTIASPPRIVTAQDQSALRSDQLQRSFVSVVKQASPSVVQISTGSGLGSGVIFDSNGDIVTNAHVVGSSRRVTVTLASGRVFRGAKVVGSFAPDDLAVVHVNASGLQAMPIADSSSLQVGDIVLAMGNPLGLRSSVTDGIVSAVGRTVSEGSGGPSIADVIQTSAPINPGNSGGALVDLSGALVGIPTLAATDPELGGQANGIGFAIPSNTVRDIAGQLIAHGKVENSHRAFLGVQLSQTLVPSGAYVGKVTANGPAQKAGIRGGDVILSVAGHPTRTPDGLSSVLANLKPGQRVSVSYERPDGSHHTVQVVLAQYPG
ncbi:MAG: S1C family serine protease [Gaiellaceae bacterium]